MVAITKTSSSMELPRIIASLSGTSMVFVRLPGIEPSNRSSHFEEARDTIAEYLNSRYAQHRKYSSFCYALSREQQAEIDSLIQSHNKSVEDRVK